MSTVPPPTAIEANPQDVWFRLSQAERDAAYNNNEAVADSADQIERRNAESARVRAHHPGALDVPYAPGARTCFDLYPAAPYGAPCFVFVHGGYWQRNSREVFACIVEGLAEVGWSVAIPGFSLAPNATLTQIVAEIRASLDWLEAERYAYGLLGPVLLAGWSAGAQLAALALDHPCVAAGLAISGVFDLAPIRDTFLNAALNLTDAEVETLSPLRLPAVAKPMAIAYGTAELPALVHDSLRFHAHRVQQDAPGPLLAVPGADHFSILDGFRRGDSFLLQTARLLLAGHES